MALPSEIASTPARRVAVTAVGWTVGLAFTAPLLWMLSSSLRPGADIFANLSRLTVGTLLPTQWTFDNFTSLLSGSFARATLNSLFVTAVTVVVGLVLCAMAAFALAALEFRGAGAVFAVVILSFLVPFDAIAIPLANLFQDWHLQNTYTGLILPGLGNGLAIFVLRQFFLGIPRELTEAARVDGLHWWGVFWRIYRPLSGPALIGAGFTLFLFQWQAYMWPLLIGTGPDKVLGPIALANLNGQFSVDFGALFAGSLILTVIPMVLLLRYQRHFTDSLSTTGSKD
jgi:ABC-type glycerol-3-phosphate transport system permease component